MKLTILVVCALFFWQAGRVFCQPGRAAGSGCALVEQALAAYKQVKPGITRKEVEKNFDYDGGLNFAERGRYRYRGCDYIKLEVDFKSAPRAGNALTSPNDTVTTVSRLFIDYPTQD